MSDRLGHPPSLPPLNQRGEKKANRNNPTFKKRPNPLKIKEKTFSNRDKNTTSTSPHFRPSQTRLPLCDLRPFSVFSVVQPLRCFPNKRGVFRNARRFCQVASPENLSVELRHRISNRYTKLLEITLTHSKQTAATQSNRYNLRGSFPPLGLPADRPGMRQFGPAARSENLIVNLGHSASRSLDVKKLTDKILAFHRAPSRLLPLLQRIENRARQRLRVLRRDEPAGLALANQIREAPHIRRHYGNAAQQRLDGPAAILRMRWHHRQIQVRVQRRHIRPRSQKRERPMANRMAAISQSIFIPPRAIPAAANHNTSNLGPLVSHQIQRREKIFMALQPSLLTQKPLRRVHVRHHAHERNVGRDAELVPQPSGAAGRELPDVGPRIRKKNSIRRNSHFQIFSPRPLASGNPTIRRPRQPHVEIRERRRLQVQRSRHLKHAGYFRSAAQRQADHEHGPHMMAMNQVGLNFRDKFPASRENSGNLPRTPRREIQVDRDDFGPGPAIRRPETLVSRWQRHHHVDAEAGQHADLFVGPSGADSRFDDVQYFHGMLAPRSLPQKLRYGQSGEEVVIRSSQPLANRSRDRVFVKGSL
jgi:hypothetical protein